MHRVKTFRHDLRQGAPLFGLFTRLADPDAVEALAASALDFVVLDVEHGSLGRGEISRIAAVSRANDLPLLVRLAAPVHADIHHAVAVGATGVIVSHVADGAQAQAIAAFARGAALERAYAGMGRAADFRRTAWPEFEASIREQFVVVAQIDDAAGLRAAKDIAATDGIDAVFVGSLSLALACATNGTAGTERMVSDICKACTSAGCRVGMHIVVPSELPSWTAQGVNLFVVGNDLNLLRQGADRTVEQLRGSL